MVTVTVGACASPQLIACRNPASHLVSLARCKSRKTPQVRRCASSAANGSARKLAVPDKPGLRPTPDRVRETLFNWLGQDLTGWRCVDAFAGTGALGLEAASRGAADVLLVEQDAELVALLRAAQAKLDADAVRVERANGLTVLARLCRRPAWTWSSWTRRSTPASSKRRWPRAAAALAAEGLVYLEAPDAWADDKLAPYGLVARAPPEGRGGARASVARGAA